MIVLVKGEEDYFLLYDKTNARHHELDREYSHKGPGSESSVRMHPCRLCDKVVQDDVCSHICKDNRAKMHKTCLKRYLADSTDEKVVQSKRNSLCPFCETPIELSEVMDPLEFQQYKRERKLQRVRSVRANSLSGYVPKLKTGQRSDSANVSRRESSRERVKRHEFKCDLCAKDCEIAYIENKVFIHNSKECKGGCCHKECLISALSLHFWRRYEKYYGQRILLLTKTEATGLRREWVCPLCAKPLKEPELRSLVTEREWKQQIEMRDKRDRRRYPGSPLKDLLAQAEGGIVQDKEIGEFGIRPKRIPFGEEINKDALGKKMLKKPERRAGVGMKPWLWSEARKRKALFCSVVAQSAAVCYMCWSLWSSMILPCAC